MFVTWYNYSDGENLNDCDCLPQEKAILMLDLISILSKLFFLKIHDIIFKVQYFLFFIDLPRRPGPKITLHNISKLIMCMFLDLFNMK